MRLAAKDVASLEGNVDMLIVAETASKTCGWAGPPQAKGSRAMLLRLAIASSKHSERQMSGVYLCGSGAKDGKVGAVTELEVVPSEWTPDAMPYLQLKRIVAAAATSLRPAD